MTTRGERSSSAADKVRESIDRLRTLPLDEIDKDLYELSLKNEAKAAAEVQANLALASATPADDDAITAAIQEVEAELKREEKKKHFDQVFLGLALAGFILGGFFSLKAESRVEFQRAAKEWIELIFGHVDRILQKHFPQVKT
jgi:hypothetical protein